MAGVKSLLKAAANDMVQTEKAQVKFSENTPEKINSIETVVEKLPKEITSKKVADKKTKEASPKKNLGGRPTNKEKGIQSRKQYTLTLKEDTYNLFLEKARKEDISFAKFMERAGIEYINNHM